MQSRRALVACEYSGRVRDALIDRGWDAVSCDLSESESDKGPHIVGDVSTLLRDYWDLVIAFPPCTYLSDAGRGHWNRPGRAQLRQEAAEFFVECYNANSVCVCVENPKGFMNTAFRKPDQTIHPWYFGDRFMKRTCLWLRGLPKLVYRMRDDLFGKRTATEKPQPISIDNVTHRVKRRYTVDSAFPSKDRAKERARTYPGIANAMAEQWTPLSLAV